MNYKTYQKYIKILTKQKSLIKKNTFLCFFAFKLLHPTLLGLDEVVPHLPLNSALRFSTKAAAPSLKSSVFAVSPNALISYSIPFTNGSK